MGKNRCIRALLANNNDPDAGKNNFINNKI